MHKIASSVFALALVFLPIAARPQEQNQPPSATPAEPAAPKQGEVIIPGQGIAPMPEEAKTQPAKAEPALDEGGKYAIRQGDTLWDISNAFLRDPFLWPLIWKVNPYIRNPDLIYPGNKLVIPSLAPIERAMEAPEERAPEEKAAEEAQPEREVAALPPRPKPRPAAPAPEEEAPARPRIILPEEAAVPIIDKYSMLNAGYIAQEETDDRIIGSPEEKTIFGYDDVVYLNIESREDVNVGDRFLIYMPLNNVKHPETGENFGRLIKVLGVLQVAAKDRPEVLTGRLTISFDASEPGSLLAPYQEPTLVYERPKKTEKSIERGWILEVVDGRTINAQTDVVYLDKGSADGVEPGDRFSVYVEPRNEDRPRRAVGEVQVFLVKERTSTAVVRKSSDTLAKGDVVEYKP